MSPAPDAPLSRALQAAVRELDLLADEIDWLELRLGAARLAGEPLYEAQAVDALLQQVKGLSAFLGGLARSCDPAWRVRRSDAAGPLKLSAQKARLSGRKPAPSPPAGEFEFL